MPIPTGVPLKLWVFSRHVTLTDSAGSPVDNSGGRVPFEAVAGRDHQVVLNVSGPDPRASEL
jgi:stringent starvation protein B